MQRTVKYFSVKVTSEGPYIEISGRDIQFVTDISCSTNGGMLGKVPNRNSEILPAPHQQLHARNAFRCLRFIFAVLAGQFPKPKLSAQRGTPWVRPIMIVNCAFRFVADDAGRVFKILTDDIVGLLSVE